VTSGKSESLDVRGKGFFEVLLFFLKKNWDLKRLPKVLDKLCRNDPQNELLYVVLLRFQITTPSSTNLLKSK